jgi:hypothetical protein
MFLNPKEPAMQSLPLAVRLFAAATAAVVTLLLLGTVVSIAEPQRSVLIAKAQHGEPGTTARTLDVTVASLGVAANGK